MPIYFIADLHLSESHPQLTALFQKFIQEKAVHAQAVYILGDLFDFWIGDDENSPLVQTIKQTIRSLTKRGIACYFIHGNRDFLIGKTFARDTGMTLLPEYTVIDLFGTPTLLCHGDTLCTDDHSYQKFRRTVHQKMAATPVPAFAAHTPAEHRRQNPQAEQTGQATQNRRHHGR